MSVKKKITVQPGKKKAAIQRTPSRRTRTVSEEPTEVSEPTPAAPIKEGPVILPVDYAANQVAEIILSLPIEARAAALQGAMDQIRRQSNYEMRVSEETMEWARVGARKLKALMV